MGSEMIISRPPKFLFTKCLTLIVMPVVRKENR